MLKFEFNNNCMPLSSYLLHIVQYFVKVINLFTFRTHDSFNTLDMFDYTTVTVLTFVSEMVQNRLKDAIFTTLP